MCGCVCASDLKVEQDGSYPHGLADLHVVGEEGEAWGALVVGGEDFDVYRGDGAPDTRQQQYHTVGIRQNPTAYMPQ